MKTICWECGKEIDFVIPENRTNWSELKTRHHTRYDEEDDVVYNESIYYPNNFVVRGQEECDYPFIRTYCSKCEPTVKKKRKKMEDDYWRLRAEVMFECGESNNNCLLSLF